MKKSFLTFFVLAALSPVCAAASSVSLYGTIEEGVLVQKAKHSDTTVQLVSGFSQESHWGIKGIEDLGSGYSTGFILEQGFSANNGKAWLDDGSGIPGGDYSGFNREAFLYIGGGFGKLGFGRTGALSSGVQSNSILTGWAFGPDWGITAGGMWGRLNNVVAYSTPTVNGFSAHLMYSNGTSSDTQKWSENSHYYGIGVLYDAHNIKSSLIFELVDHKDSTGRTFSGEELATMFASPAEYDLFISEGYKSLFYPKQGKDMTLYYGLEYDMGSITPMFFYRWIHQSGGMKWHQFGLSAKTQVAGGTAIFGIRYLFGKDGIPYAVPSVRDPETAIIRYLDSDQSSWNIGAAYVYPLSKRTALKAYAGYADSGKALKNETSVRYNGFQVYLGMRHSF